jgi:uncharacterized protein (DUF302 family)/uncharacterized membrane protein YidH (DUF202 family)
MTGKSGSASDFLAVERTFLAWIRTGLALMGFGFVVARFGLFLQSLHGGQPDLPVSATGISPWIGTALITMGVVVNLWCAAGHIRLVQQLKHGESDFERPSAPAVTLALVLAILGLAIAVPLMRVRQLNSIREEKLMNLPSGSGIVTLQTHQSVDQTVEKLERILETKAIKLFAVIDHSGEAQKASLEMRPTKLLIFGSPKAGTPLMVSSPTAAIDLPLKVLVWEDHDGRTCISYNTPSYLQARHAFPAELIQNIAAVEALARTVAE